MIESLSEFIWTSHRQWISEMVTLNLHDKEWYHEKLQSLALDDVIGPTKNRSRLDNLCGSLVKEVTKQSFVFWDNYQSLKNAVNFFILKNEYLINVDKIMEDYSPSKIILSFAEMLQANVPRVMF